MSAGFARERGFTLIEMVVVVAIVGILAAAARPLWTLARQRGDELQLRQSLRTLRQAIDAYKQAHADGRIVAAAGASGYPPNLAVLVDGAVDATLPKERRIYFLRRMPRDPFADPGQSAVDTWGLRSYESSAESPRPGADVFDVYAKTDRRGLDGTPYRSW